MTLSNNDEACSFCSRLCLKTHSAPANNAAFREADMISRSSTGITTDSRKGELNIWTQFQTGYVCRREDMEAYLKELFGQDFDTSTDNLTVRNSMSSLVFSLLNTTKTKSARWKFYAPRQVTDAEIR
jgi:hypothetical protein